MQGWQKVALGLGLTAAVGTVGYLAYSKLFKKEKVEEVKKEVAKNSEDDWVSDSDEDRRKPVDIMDEVLLESIEYLDKLHKTAIEDSSESPEEISNYVEKRCKAAK